MGEKIGYLVLIFTMFISLAAGCIDNEEEIPDHPNLILYISNQSQQIDPVDIHVHIDGECVEDCYYYRGDSHNWTEIELTLRWGDHTICASTIMGNCSLERDFHLNDKMWAVLDHYSTGLDLNLMDSPPAFM